MITKNSTLKSDQDYDQEQDQGFIVIMRKYFLFFVLIIILTSCGKSYTPEQEAYIKEIEDFRAKKNDEMKNDLSSPFHFKGKVAFHNLNYFDVDPEFVFKSKLTEYEQKDTVTIFGTKGEPRKVVRHGFVQINYKGKDYKISVYEGTTKTGQTYHSIWFTDLTTNKESYGVGRYIDFELVNDPNYLYEVDFNLAYNPYCAYSPNYSCAIPTKEDFIPVEIKAGEKKFHD
ncbi:MAG: DUF1684 domain-containing protein [Ignavibacteriales bacterium]|nr:DUF1684 domain-containing protein [Ignavibacteriales bacterium]